MKNRSFFTWLTALCCRSFGMSWACRAVRSSFQEQHRSVVKQCSFSWAWTSACMKPMAWARAQDLTSCQVQKLINCQGKKKKKFFSKSRIVKNYLWCLWSLCLIVIKSKTQKTPFLTYSCGKVVPGCRYKLANVDCEGTGEICFWGRNIFMGFLNMEDKTREALDEDGWLHSGDLGKVDEEGFLYITGRIKGSIISSNKTIVRVQLDISGHWLTL